MNKKITALFLLAAVFAWSFALNVAIAKDKDDADQTPPEADGTYDVPGHPNLKVRVFVHRPNPAKPGQNPSDTQTCTLSDPVSSAIVGKTIWQLPTNKNVVYTLNPASVPSTVGGTNLAVIASNAFAQWQGQVGSKVSIVPDATTTSVTKAAMDGKNIIAWGRTSGTALAVTYTWYNPGTGLAVETDTIFNSKFPWEWSPFATGCAYANYYDAQDILTHELGHWYGLDDEYDASFANNTMYGYGSKGEIKKDTLTDGDIFGIKAIYY